MTTVGRLMARATFALAALLLALGPLMDSAAKAACEDAPPHSMMHFIGSLDVIDDVLDHIPGQPPSSAQIQLQLPHAFPDRVEVPVPMMAIHTGWRLSQDRALPSIRLDGLERPPRA